MPTVRHMGGASSSSSGNHGFKPKTLYEAWCSDSGAYPVMGVIVFACVFSVGTGLYIMGTHEDARVSKSSRKAIFRGPLKNEN